jgi:hypothetical protein
MEVLGVAIVQRDGGFVFFVILFLLNITKVMRFFDPNSVVWCLSCRARERRFIIQGNVRGWRNTLVPKWFQCGVVGIVFIYGCFLLP